MGKNLSVLPLYIAQGVGGVKGLLFSLALIDPDNLPTAA